MALRGKNRALGEKATLFFVKDKGSRGEACTLQKKHTQLG